MVHQIDSSAPPQVDHCCQTTEQSSSRFSTKNNNVSNLQQGAATLLLLSKLEKSTQHTMPMDDHSTGSCSYANNSGGGSRSKVIVRCHSGCSRTSELSDYDNSIDSKATMSADLSQEAYPSKTKSKNGGCHHEGIESDDDNNKGSVDIPRRPRRRKSMGKQKSFRTESGGCGADDNNELKTKIRVKSSSTFDLSDDSSPGIKKKKKIRVLVKRIEVNHNLDNDSVVSELSEVESERKDKSKEKVLDPTVMLYSSESDQHDGDHCCHKGGVAVVKNEEGGDEYDTKYVLEGTKDSEKINRWLEKLGKIGVARNGSGKITRSLSGKLTYTQKSHSSRSNRSLLGDEDDDDHETYSDTDLDNDPLTDIITGTSRLNMSITDKDFKSDENEADPPPIHGIGGKVVSQLCNTDTAAVQPEVNKPSILRHSDKSQVAVNRVLSTSDHGKLLLMKPICKRETTDATTTPTLSSRHRSPTVVVAESTTNHRGRARSSGPATRIRTQEVPDITTTRQPRVSPTVASLLKDQGQQQDHKRGYIQRTKSEKSSLEDCIVPSRSTSFKSLSARRGSLGRCLNPNDPDEKNNKGTDTGSSYLPGILNEPKTKYYASESSDTTTISDTYKSAKQLRNAVYKNEDAMDDVKTNIKPRRPSMKQLLLSNGDDPTCNNAMQNSNSCNPINVEKYFTNSSSPSSVQLQLEVMENVHKQEIVPLKLKGSLAPRSSSRSRSSSRQRSKSSSRTRSKSRSKSSSSSSTTSGLRGREQIDAV